jgi:hypothetical protein
MTGPEYNDRIIKVLTGSGVRTDELQGRGEDFISSLRDSARGEVLNQLYLRGGGVAPIFFQEMYFEEKDMIQEDDCVVKFFCPPPLYKPNGMPWVEWVGGKNWSRDSRFRVAVSRTDLIDKNAHHITGRSNLVRAFYDNAMACWWVYRNKGANSFAVRQICADPYKVPEYNIDKDDYPFPTDQDDFMMDIIIKRYFRTIQAPIDAKSNSRNDLQQPQER